MQDDTFNSFIKAISRDRLSGYIGQGSFNDDCIAKYLWNIALCKSFYPMLNMLEVCIRNATHRTLTQGYGKDWYSNGRFPLSPYQKERVKSVRDELRKQAKAETDGRIVAELQFGFWVSMYGIKLDREWRGQTLRKIIPHAPAKERNRKTLHTALDDIRHFRNRVFHHERILHCNPSVHHQQCNKLLGWVNSDAHRLVSAIDNYPDVYSGGLEKARSVVACIDVPNDS